MNNLQSVFLIAILTLIQVSIAAAEPPKMKMTTEILPGIAPPDRLESRLDTLNLFDGVPDAETARKIYDNLDFRRAVPA